MNKRIAYMRCSTELIEALLPPGKVLDCVAEKIGPVDYAWLHEALKLPSNASITAVSTGAFFHMNQVGIRVECPDFVETPEGCIIPEVEVMYAGVGNQPVIFLGWKPGAAVAKKAEPFFGTVRMTWRDREPLL